MEQPPPLTKEEVKLIYDKWQVYDPNCRRYDDEYDEDDDKDEEEYELEYGSLKVTLPLNIKKLDKLWRETSSSDNYIHGVFDNILYPAKYVASNRDLHNNSVERPPEIGFYDDKASFVNGRHRFANIRDSGVRRMIPVIVDLEYVPTLKRLGLTS